ncbi:carbohydrate ABC transporter permease [Paenibacillus montanisoli]|uniref:Sugar ABC transporter permease n=1 Tax=Paenibacillus montanisoli TaxID=2081970 RepID=A0A328U4J6_9BACL|nr:sugar ABC transporter permease [Paenibacillus montanisoli]RAP74786.1 sugar ABC transporter permease [Paenibacillus montanisoli]
MARSKYGKRPDHRNKKMFIAVSLTPIMLLFITFTLLPIVMACVLAFSSYDGLRGVLNFNGFDNIRGLLNDELFRMAIWNTFRFVLLAVPLNIAITLLLAMAINKVRNAKLKHLLRTIFFVPVIAPLVGSVLVWQTFFNYDHGLFNMLLEFVGLQPVHWLTETKPAMISVILMVLWADIGYNIVLFMSGLDSIPDMFYEAAKLDGAGRFRRFRHITLPLLSRTTLFVAVMTVLSYFQAFTQFKVLTGGGPSNSTRVLSLQIYDTAFKYFDLGVASTMAMVLFAIMLSITWFQLKIGKSQWEY